MAKTPAPERGVVIAVDPGHAKCGLAAVTGDGQAILLQIVAREEVCSRVAQLMSQYPVTALLVGNRTGSAQLMAQLRAAELPVTPQAVPEHDSTLRARQAYLADHPPRGWRRLIPPGMRMPPRPVDDYAALILARDWLARTR